jgi:hypothetical protein
MSSLFDQIEKLDSYLGVTDLCRTILANPLGIIIIIALIARYLASGPIKDIEGGDKRSAWSVLKLHWKHQKRLGLKQSMCTILPIGSKVRAINSVEEWNALLDESKSSGQFIVADFYATWCPPCKTWEREHSFILCLLMYSITTCMYCESYQILLFSLHCIC